MYQNTDDENTGFRRIKLYDAILLENLHFTVRVSSEKNIRDELFLLREKIRLGQ